MDIVSIWVRNEMKFKGKNCFDSSSLSDSRKILIFKLMIKNNKGLTLEKATNNYYV